MPKEPREQASEADKVIASAIEQACVGLFRHIDGSPDDRSIPPASSDLWVSVYRNDLCSMVRNRMDYMAICLDREILQVWLRVRKNPEKHGVYR